MHFLLFSDIHFNFDGYDTECMRERLLKYLKSTVKNIDAIFIAGDLRFAPKKEFSPATKNYIYDIVSIMNNCPFYISAGNHDLNRSEPRKSIINTLKQKYKSSIGEIKTDDLIHLNLDFSDFYKFIEDSNGTIIGETNPHRYIENPEANIICLNTAIMSGTTSEEEYGQLIVGIKFLEDCLKKINTEKPTIVYGHHSLESLRYEEQIRVLELFHKYNIHIYLCGHNHIFKINNLSYDNNYYIYEMFAGNLYAEDRYAQCGFLEIDLSENDIVVQCHEWDYNFRKWHRSNTFSEEENGFKKHLPLCSDKIEYNKSKEIAYYAKSTSKKPIHNVMMFPDEEVAITVPVYKKKAYTNPWSFVHFNEYAYTLKLINAISTDNLNIETDYKVTYPFSEIHIGGPTVNENTLQYIKNYVPTYQAHVKKPFVPNNVSTLPEDFIIESKETGFSLTDRNGKTTIYYRADKINDIGILIRLKINNKKTIHLIFGTGKRGTMAALNYITNYSEEIIEKYGNKDYFLLLWSNYSNFSIDFSKGIQDLSDYLNH